MATEKQSKLNGYGENIRLMKRAQFNPKEKERSNTIKSSSIAHHREKP